MITENLFDLLDDNNKLKPEPAEKLLFRVAPLAGRDGQQPFQPVTFLSLEEATDFARGVVARIEVVAIEPNIETLVHAMNGVASIGRIVKTMHGPFIRPAVIERLLAK